MKIIIVSFIVLFTLGCASNDKEVQEAPLTAINYSETDITSLLKKLNQNIIDRDTISIEANWSLLMEFDTKLIEYFMKFEQDDSIDKEICQWYNRRISEYRFQVNSMPTNKLLGLYYINAIYYNDYFFAIDRELYEINNVDSVMLNDRMFYHEKYGNQLPPSDKTSDNELELGWKLVKDWIKTNEGLSLKEIRDKGIRPFKDSELFWYGEKGGYQNIE